MCGIAGEIRAAQRGEEAAAAQLACLRHRGPDAEGAFHTSGGWVGQTRLSIIDLRHGDPPITNEAGTLGGALNGEIYNHRELRSTPQRGGQQFSTERDTA